MSQRGASQANIRDKRGRNRGGDATEGFDFRGWHAKVVPLGAPALALLKSLHRVEGCPYVLPGGKDGAHYVGLP